MAADTPFRRNQRVTGTTIVSGERKTGRYVRAAAAHNGRAVAIITDEEQPHLRAPFHVFADTLETS